MVDGRGRLDRKERLEGIRRLDVRGRLDGEVEKTGEGD